MRFRAIELLNYRQYKNVKIEFGNGEQFVIIEGANGAGKTNILNAITWCLYEQEAHLGSKYKGLPIINTQTFHELPHKGMATVEVRLFLEDDKGKREVFERKMDVYKKDRNDFEYGRSKLAARFQVDRDWKTSEDPEFRVERILPKDIQEYFFFDGERLDTYFGRAPRKGIIEEVHRISQLKVFQTVIEHLDKMMGEYTKDIREISPKADEFLNRWHNATKASERAATELKELEEKKAKAASLEAKALEELKKLPISGDKLKQYQEKREHLEKRLITKEEEIESAKRARQDRLIEYSKLIFTMKCMTHAKLLMANKVERGEIPPEFKRKFIERLLEKGVCICHREIVSGPEREAVQTLLQECDEFDEMSQELIREHHNLESS